MKWYKVWVASTRYQKPEALTYASELELKNGNVVVIPLASKQVLGFIDKETAKPKFVTKQIVKALDGIFLPKHSQELFVWLMEYYPAGSGATLQLFLPSSLIAKKTVKTAATAKTKPKKPFKLPTLTKQQKSALETINSSNIHRFLLHGDTGSGKTRIYIERSTETIKAGKSVLILTPEIALTPQLAEDFSAQFDNQVIIIHSNLTPKARREYWLRIAISKEPLVVIGPRSALFSPLKNLGLIVVDEFHEPAYKQEQSPRYHSLRVAGALAKIQSCEIIYGSATPAITEYHLAETTKMPIIRMDAPAKTVTRPVRSSVINLANKDSFSKSSFLSDELLKAIKTTLDANEQVLIYLNRRGTARIVLCQNCGWQALCPRCDLPLTYHGDGHTLRCHTCGYKTAPPLSCPVCKSTDLQYRTVGTKALVNSLQELFPSAKIQRFDTDLGVDDRLDKHYADIKAGKVDILVGTQMLGKGLDLPKLGLVGVVAADTSLYLPDYTSAERSYQLLHQVLGRVGRGHRDGQVIIQTYLPDSPLLQAAVAKDWQSFYKSELIERRTFLFPPFCYLLKISVSRKSSASAEQAIISLHSKLQTTKLRVRLSDPAPAYYEHTHGFYHWQLVLKATDRNELIKAIKALPAGNWTYDLDPSNLL